MFAAGFRARGNRAGLFGLLGRRAPRAVLAAGLAAALTVGVVEPVSAAAPDDPSAGQDAAAADTTHLRRIRRMSRWTGSATRRGITCR